jgi:hypothetical protein
LRKDGAITEDIIKDPFFVSNEEKLTGDERRL